MKLPFRQALVLLTFAFFPGIAQSLYFRDRISWQAPIAAADLVILKDARAWGDGAIWIDARSQEAFDQEHVPGAVLLNEDRWNELLPAALANWSPQKKVVVYCSARSCGAAREVARRLRQEGNLTNVYVLDGGWEAWIADRKGTP